MAEDEHSGSALKLSWLWVIEYVASLQEVDPSFLHGLIAEAPEFLEDLGKDMREMVALRCLEDLFDSKNVGQSNIPSTAKPKFAFDISNSCEDVLLSTVKETSVADLRTGPDPLKWDMQSFLMHKRTTLPKCSLELLKDEDNDGSIGTSNSLLMAREVSTIPLPLENGDSHHQNLLPMKRNGNVVDDYSKDQGDVGDGDLHLNVKRIKCNVSTAEHSLSPHFEDGHEKSVATNRIVTSANTDAIHELEHNQSGNADGATKMPQHRDRPCQDITEGEVIGEESRNGTSLGKQKSPIDISSSGFHKEISVENSYEEEDTSNDGHKYHHENFDVAMERSQFLSSHCTLSHVSLSNYSKLSLCVKCSKGEKLLVCNALDCPMVVHEKCLGCRPRFDKKGNFYCPYCAYSYAISKYMEAKSRVASAKKELARFVRKDQKQRVEESDETNGRHHKDQVEKRKLDNKFKEPIISCAAPSLMEREEKESEGMPQEKLSMREPGKEDSTSFDPKSNIANQLSRGKEILLNEKEGEGGIQKEVIEQQSNDLLQKSVCVSNSDEKTINDKSKEDEVFSDAIRSHLQRLKKQCVEPENNRWIKPNRVPWTPEEEEMLKEGVKKFSRMGERIPWTQILDYGNSVFLSRRSAMQLKDKWRNMERKS